MSWRLCPSWGIDSLQDCVLVETLIVYKIVSYKLKDWLFTRLCPSWKINSLQDCVLVDALIAKDCVLVDTLIVYKIVSILVNALIAKDRVLVEILIQDWVRVLTLIAKWNWIEPG